MDSRVQPLAVPLSTFRPVVYTRDVCLCHQLEVIMKCLRPKYCIDVYMPVAPFFFVFLVVYSLFSCIAFYR